MDTIVAQSAIAELAQEYNRLATYRAGLVVVPWQPYTGREDALAEAAQGAYRDAMQIVARQFGIKLTWGKE